MVGLLDTAPLTGAQGGGLRFSEGISSRARNANVGTASGLSVCGHCFVYRIGSSGRLRLRTYVFRSGSQVTQDSLLDQCFYQILD